MASRIIETHAIGSELTSLIKRSSRRLRLVSPYLNLAHWKHLNDAILDAAHRNVDCALVYRRDKRAEYKALIEAFVSKGVRCYDFERLHSKVYIADDACIITSMNLDGSSASSSEEFALYSDEPGVVTAVAKYADELIANRSTEEIKPKSTLAKVGGSLLRVGSAVADAAVSLLPEAPGYCVRCHKDVPYDMKRPLCDDCYKAWSKFKNPDYSEKYCHDCGKDHKSSVSRPVCLTCYKKIAPVRA